MLLADVSKTMGELAAAINKKQTELEALQEEYRSKIRVLDSYLAKFSYGDTSKASIASETILRQIQEPISCPNCNHTLYELEKPSEFVVVPAKQIQLIGANASASDLSKISSLNPASMPLVPDVQSNMTLTLPKSSSKSKKTCSFCHKNGHSRARCFARLNTERDAGSKSKPLLE